MSAIRGTVAPDGTEAGRELSSLSAAKAAGGGQGPATRRSPPAAFCRAVREGSEWVAWLWWNYKPRVLGVHRSEAEAREHGERILAMLDFAQWPATPGRDNVSQEPGGRWKGRTIARGECVETEPFGTRDEAHKALRALVGEEPPPPGLKWLGNGYGVRRLPRGKWEATIRWNKQKRYLGQYDTKSEAQAHHDRILKALIDRKWPVETTYADGTNKIAEHHFVGYGIVGGDVFETDIHATASAAQEALQKHKLRVRGKLNYSEFNISVAPYRGLPKNVYFDKGVQKFVVKVQKGGVRVHVGTYCTVEEAEENLQNWRLQTAQYDKLKLQTEDQPPAWTPRDIVNLRKETEVKRGRGRLTKKGAGRRGSKPAKDWRL